MAITEELKEAISHLSSAEKDKLIFRLLKKDIPLAKRLLFELVSDKSAEELREELQEQLKVKCYIATQHLYSIGYLSMDIREMSGLINKHVTTTKDKYGDAWLNIFLLNEILEKSSKDLMGFKRNKKLDKLYIAFIARIFKALLIINKLHEDYLIDFIPVMEKLAKQIGDNPVLMDIAMHHGLDVNWLYKAEIPENIASIHKELRENGYLKI
ncbi:hypothetical protein [Elizabethkingia sp. M8]|uniref:hypothetical protein n=1 Tax=Elizabethkingia sp. M8 TaxID=2796140 RepID=UPI0019086A25|nr:hypothetical protein [Elizabethkingia sp. M8]QQM28076.1 hypothetical protein JCR23_06555 [Elizabethkingia sp. M8]